MSRVADPSYRWIKSPIANLDDRLLMSLDDAHFGFYEKAYLLAGKADAGGLLCDDHQVFNVDDLAWMFRRTPEFIGLAINELKKVGLIHIDPESGGFIIARFLDEQGSIDDASRLKARERQRARRERIGAGISDFLTSDIEKKSERERDPDPDEIKNRGSRDKGSLSRDNTSTGGSRSRCSICGKVNDYSKDYAYETIYDAILEKYPDGDSDLAFDVTYDHTGDYENWCPCEIERWTKLAISSYEALWEGQKEGKHPLAAFSDDYGRVVSYIG